MQEEGKRCQGTIKFGLHGKERTEQQRIRSYVAYHHHVLAVSLSCSWQGGRLKMAPQIAQ